VTLGRLATPTTSSDTARVTAPTVRRQVSAHASCRSPGAKPEFRVLVAAARERLDEPDRALIRALVEDAVDWEELLRLARHNRVEALLDHSLRATVPDAVPESVASRLKARADSNRERGRRLVTELADLVRLLDGAGIPALVFKGPVLAAQIYEDRGLRFFWDLDLLVREEDIERVSELVMTRGYRRYSELDRLEARIFAGYHFAHTLFHDERAVEVDVHWRLMPAGFGPRLAWSDLSGRAIRAQLGGVDLWTFSTEDALLALAAHGAKEEWRRLQMVCDVAGYIRSAPALDWTTCLDRAAGFGGRRMLLLAAHLAHARLGADLPAAVHEAIAADRVIPELVGRVWPRLQSADSPATSPFVLTRFRYLVLDRVRDRLRYAREALMEPRLVHVRLLRLPPALSKGYVLVRIVHDYLLLPLWLLAKRCRRLANKWAARQ